MKNELTKAVELRAKAGFILGKKVVIAELNKIIDEYCSTTMTAETALSKIVEYLNREEINTYVSKDTK